MNEHEKHDKVAEGWHDLLFGVRRSIRYHARRRRHFDRLARTSVFLSLVFGSATFAALLGVISKDQATSQHLAAIFALVVTVVSAVDLVLGSALRARDNHDLEREFSALEREILLAEKIDAPTLAKLTAKRLEIEEKEEPPLRVLDTLCHNELVRAMGYDEATYTKRVSWLQRALANWVDFMPDSIH